MLPYFDLSYYWWAFWVFPVFVFLFFMESATLNILVPMYLVPRGGIAGL